MDEIIETLPMDALVFDYDGVLADTEPLHWRSWAELLASYNLSLTWRQYLEIGLGVQDRAFFESFRKLASPEEVPESIWAKNRIRKMQVTEWCLKSSPIPRDTIAMLHSLRRRRLGLVTSSARYEVEPVLHATGVFEYFSSRIYGEDVTNPKPDPAPYRLAAASLGVQSGLAFEDSEAGIQSARMAGFRAMRVDHPRALGDLVFQTI
jgi:HAD superfamily hydrolase (TIGR01509 family)